MPKYIINILLGILLIISNDKPGIAQSFMECFKNPESCSTQQVDPNKIFQDLGGMILNKVQRKIGDTNHQIKLPGGAQFLSNLSPNSDCSKSKTQQNYFRCRVSAARKNIIASLSPILTKRQCSHYEMWRETMLNTRGYFFRPKVPRHFYQIGDTGTNNNNKRYCNTIVQINPEIKSRIAKHLARPRGWKMIWSTSWLESSEGEGSLWRAVPPNNKFVCMGNVAQKGFSKPNVPRYRCIHKRHLNKVNNDYVLWKNDGGESDTEEQNITIFKTERSGLLVSLRGSHERHDWYELKPALFEKPDPRLVEQLLQKYKIKIQEDIKFQNFQRREARLAKEQKRRAAEKAAALKKHEQQRQAAKLRKLKKQLAEAKKKAAEESRKQALAEAKRHVAERERRIAAAKAKRQAEGQKRAAEEARHRAMAEARRKAAEESRRRAIAEARRKAIAEAKRQADEEAKRRAITEARRKAAEESRRKALAVAKRKADEEAKRRAIAEAVKKAAKEARRKALAEAKRKAAQEARRKALAEAKRKAAEEATRRAIEETQRKAAEAVQRKALAEAKRKAAEEARRKALAEGKRKAAEEATRRAIEEAQRKAAEAIAEAKRKAAEAIAEAKRRLAEEVRRKALAEAQRKAAEEVKRRALAEAQRKAAEAKLKAAEEARRLDWRNKGRPVKENYKRKHFGKRVVILLPGQDILELNPERDQSGRVSGLKVIAGCKYNYAILMNLTGSALRAGGFEVISDKAILFGKKGSKARFSFNRNVYPDRYIEFKGFQDRSTSIIGESGHNRYKNGKIRTDLSLRDKEFFKENYGCLAQRKSLKVVLMKNDLGLLDPANKHKLQPSDILVLPFSGKEDPLDSKTRIKGLKVELE